MTRLATNAQLHQGCSGAVLPVGWWDALLLPSWVLGGGSGSRGAGAPTWLALCLCGHLSSPAGTVHLSHCDSHPSEKKIKWQKSIFA